MRRITDEELILHYYGELPDPEAIDREIDGSPELESRFRELRSVLDAVSEVEAPEPPLEYGARLWRQLEPRIAGDPPATRPWLHPLLGRGWAVATAAALLLMVGVFVGRLSQQPADRLPVMTASQRILADTVAGHLQRAEILLLELANAEEGGELDFSHERGLARELSRSNRLYRQAAKSKGYKRTAALLDDLELLFLEIAHASDLVSDGDLAQIQRRLEEGDLLFKVQVVGSRLRQMTEPDFRAVDSDRGKQDA